MAFFKFRLPRSDRSAAVADSDSSADNVEAVRRHARYRLIGSVVLVTTAVVGFPLLFDTQPRPVSMDTPIVIPSRQTSSAESVVATPQLPAVPLPAQAGLDPKEEVVKDQPALKANEPAVAAAPVVEKMVEKAVEPAPAAPVEKPAAKPAVTKTEHKATEKATSKSADKKSDAKPVKSTAQTSAERAQALLEGKQPEAAGASKYLIQVGAFSEAAKVNEVRSKLEHAGLKTYTQVTEGKDGKKITRVRLGPYRGKDEADKAAERIRKLGLKAALLKL